MNLLSIRNFALALLLCCHVTLVYADDVIFHKVFENGSRVEVVKHPPVLYKTTAEEQAMLDKWRKSLPPGIKIGFVPYNYYRIVDFIYQKGETQKPVLLWQTQTSQFTLHQVERELDVFDAIDYKNRIYFLLHIHNNVGSYSFSVDGSDKNANFFTVTANNFQEEYRESAKLMTRDANFTRTPDGLFSASLYKDDGDISFWKFDGNKWVRAQLPVEELLSKDVTVYGEKWHLALTREETVNNVATPEDPALEPGKRYLFTKIHLSNQAGQVSQPEVIWDLFHIRQPFEIEYRQKWSATAVVNADKNEIFLALSDRRQLWIQIFDWNGKPLKGVLTLNPWPLEPTFENADTSTSRFLTPNHAMELELPFIDTLSLALKGNILQLEVSDTTKKITQVWAISIADRDSPVFDVKWKKIAETRPELRPPTVTPNP